MRSPARYDVGQGLFLYQYKDLSGDGEAHGFFEVRG
jgi:hypothetical protein